MGVELMVSVLIGLGCSYAVWWFVYRKLRPNLTWDRDWPRPGDRHEEAVQKKYGLNVLLKTSMPNGSGHRYRRAVQNSSRGWSRRTAVDVRVEMRLRVRYPDDKTSIRIEVPDISTTPRLTPRAKGKRGPHHMAEFDLSRIADADRRLLPESVRSEIDGAGRVEKILGSGTDTGSPKVWLELFIRGTDEWSGAATFVEESIEIETPEQVIDRAEGE